MRETQESRWETELEEAKSTIRGQMEEAKEAERAQREAERVRASLLSEMAQLRADHVELTGREAELAVSCTKRKHCAKM